MKFGALQESFHTLLEWSLPWAVPEPCWGHGDQAVTSGRLLQPFWRGLDMLNSRGASFRALPEGFVSQEMVQGLSGC